MQHFQLSIFYDLQMLIQTSNFYRKYDLLFRALDLSHLHDKNCGVGRTGYSRHALLKAFIVKHLEQIKSVPRLIEFLDAHPILTEMCGFAMGCLPDESQFYRFLYETHNSVLEHIQHLLNKGLIDKEIISLECLIIDSKPVMAASRENNFKNPKRNIRIKTKYQNVILQLLSVTILTRRLMVREKTSFYSGDIAPTLLFQKKASL